MQNNLMSFTKVQSKRLYVPVVLTTILAFINGPMALILAKDDPYRTLNTFMYFSYVNKFFVYVGIFLMPLIYTRMLYDYLFDEKIADFNLSLPVSRKAQYLSGFLVTTIATAIPVVANLLFTMLLYITKAIPLPTLYIPEIAVSDILVEILVMVVAIAIITATCSFVAAFVGTRLEHFSYTVAVLALPLVIALIIQGSIMLYIYGIDEVKSLENVLYLSPFAAMFNYAFIWERSTSMHPSFLSSSLHESLFRIGLCTIIAAILFAVGLKIANNRKGEFSGRKGSRNIVAVVVDIVLSYGIGLAIALFFASIMNLERINSLVIFMTAVFSILIYVIDNFITTQNIKNLRKNVSSMIILLAISGFVFVGYITNGFGYERKLPKVEQVDHISIHYNGYLRTFDDYGILQMTGKEIKSQISDPELVEKIRSMHLQALEEMPIPCDYIRISYVTKNGKEINRFFEPSISETLELYKDLHNSEEFNKSAFNSFYLTADSFDNISVNTIGSFYREQTIKLSKSQKEQLLEAVRSDILSSINSQSIMDKGVHIGMISYTKEVKNELYDYTESFSVNEYIRSDYTRTIALLKEFGFKFSEKEELNIESIEIEYPHSQEEDNITFDKFAYITNTIPQNKLTPELVKDIFSVAYPREHIIASKEHNSMVFLYVSYWNDESSNPYSIDFCIQKSDMDKIMAKYNLM